MKLAKSLLGSIGLVVAVAGAGSVSAQNITYTGSDNQAGYDISYSIETNGTIGLLSLGDIVSSSINITATKFAQYADTGPYSASGTLYFSNTNKGEVSPVSASATSLFFDYGNRGGLNFCAGPLCYALAAYGINDDDAVVYNHGDVISEDPLIVVPFASRELDDPGRTESKLANGTYTLVLPTVQTFATAAVTGAVPEPASWATMILGMGAIGFALRRRAATATVTFA